MFNEEKEYYAALYHWCRQVSQQGELLFSQLEQQEHRAVVQQWQRDLNQLMHDISTLLDGAESDNHQELRSKKTIIPKVAQKVYQTWLFLYNLVKKIDSKTEGSLKNSAMNSFQEKLNQKPTLKSHQHQSNISNNSLISNQNSELVTANPVPIGQHTLPPLPYDYDALEPYIDEEIMRLHHQEHHQSYVDGLNKAENKMEEARRTGDFDLIKHWEREAAFHGAGHYLHTIFWNIMSPEGGGRPSGELLEQIERDFGSFEAFKQHFSEAAKKVEAVGWAILVWAPRAHRLEILQAEKHQNLSQWDVIPLLVLDVWEHAYYLQYKNKRADYVDNWWNVVNWNHVNDRYQVAKEVLWQPF